MEPLGLDKNTVFLDLREDLRAKKEPFGKIMQAVTGLGQCQKLGLRAIFNPVPLYAVLGEKGLRGQARQLGDDDWLVIFSPIDEA